MISLLLSLCIPDHCIDTLRQTFMCHGDVSIKTFDWIPGQRKPEMNAVTTRECHAWEPLMKWAKENSPSHANGPILEHPVLGRSTPLFNKGPNVPLV